MGEGALLLVGAGAFLLVGEGALLLVGEELLVLALGVNGVRPDGFSPLQPLKNNAPTATITDRDTTERHGVI